MDAAAATPSTLTNVKRFFENPTLWLVVGGLAVIAVGTYAVIYLLHQLNPTLRLGYTVGLLQDTYKGLLSVAPLYCGGAAGAGTGLKVCDYYIAGSAQSVFPSNKASDYASADALAAILSAGARWIELHIYEENGEPVVALENAKFQFRLSYNSVRLADALNAIATTAWTSSKVSNASDPLFLSLKVHEDDTNLINAVAKMIRDKLSGHLLDMTYSHQQINIAQEPVCNLLNKAVIVSGDNHKGTELDELVNISWSGPNLQRLTLTQANETHDIQTLTNFNRQNLTMVVPDPGLDFKNKSAFASWTFGCQAVLMYYGSPDDAMEEYVAKFQTASFVEKPEELRFQQPTYTAPTTQDPAKFFTPLQVKTPIYTATI